VLPTALRDLSAFLREFNELQFDLLRTLCCERSRAHPLLAELVARIVDHEQRRRYRRAGPLAQFDDPLAAHEAAEAAADALRIAGQLPLVTSRVPLTRAELLPVGVFLELLAARLSACAPQRAVAA
jgi:hypothetical protein